MRTTEQLARMMANAASVVKLITGVGNNAAWIVALEGLKHAKQCRRYRGQVKHEFKRCVEMFHEYERRLIYAEVNRMFHLEDLAPHVRKTFGDITDRQYYDFWAATGGDAYEKTKPLITSLWNKYRLSLVSHHVKDSDHVAWVMTAMAALELAVRLFKSAIRECEQGYYLPHRMLVQVFGQFDISHINKQWYKAMNMLAPDTEGFDLDPIEERNIEMGLEQLCQAWIDPTLLYNSTMNTAEEYDEVFRTKGEQKKAIRTIAEVKNETIKELENE